MFDVSRRTRRRDDPQRRLVGLLARAVAGRGEVVDALRGDVVDRVADDAVAEERLGEVAHVVDDDVGLARAALVGQRADVVGEVQLAAVRGGEALLRAAARRRGRSGASRGPRPCCRGSGRPAGP